MTVVAPRPAAVSAPAPARDPFDAGYCRSLVQDVLDPLIDGYFRARIVHGERIPERGPLILAANHSGNAFPYDGIVLDALLWRRDGLRPERKFRSVYEPELSLAWWMRPFGIDDFWRRGGGVDMTFDNLERLVERGDRVIYFPEGVPGIGKGFNRRYRLQPFSSSFALIAARHDVPVLPLYIVNAEWIHPFGYTVPALDRFMQRWFHVPFLPLPLGVAGMVFPWIWYLAFPAQLTFVIGEPLDVREALAAEGVRAFDAPDRAALRRAAARLRERMQAELMAAVRGHGGRPYDRRSLAGAWRALRGRRARALPTGWPVAFLRHERDRRRPPARGRWHALLRDWDLLAFYLPFGWPLLSLTRRFRRPPCGRRGLTRAEAHARAGVRLWRLADEPLPPRET